MLNEDGFNQIPDHSTSSLSIPGALHNRGLARAQRHFERAAHRRGVVGRTVDSHHAKGRPAGGGARVADAQRGPRDSRAGAQCDEHCALAPIPSSLKCQSTPPISRKYAISFRSMSGSHWPRTVRPCVLRALTSAPASISISHMTRLFRLPASEAAAWCSSVF